MKLDELKQSNYLKLNDYQHSAMRTHVEDPIRLAQYALGLAGEAGEVADLIKKHIGHGHELDGNKLKLELGDVLWYIAGLAYLLQTSLEEIAEANIDKLQKRYPNGFSHEASRNRSE